MHFSRSDVESVFGLSSQLGIGDVSQAIGDEVEGEDGKKDGKAGKDG